MFLYSFVRIQGQHSEYFLVLRSALKNMFLLNNLCLSFPRLDFPKLFSGNILIHFIWFLLLLRCAPVRTELWALPAQDARAVLLVIRTLGSDTTKTSTDWNCPRKISCVCLMRVRRCPLAWPPMSPRTPPPRRVAGAPDL